MTVVITATDIRDHASSVVRVARSAIGNTLGELRFHLHDQAQSGPVSMPLDAGWAETFAILSDPDMVEAIRQGEADVAAGDVVSLDEWRRIVLQQREESGQNG